MSMMICRNCNTFHELPDHVSRCPDCGDEYPVWDDKLQKYVTSNEIIAVEKKENDMLRKYGCLNDTTYTDERGGKILTVLRIIKQNKKIDYTTLLRNSNIKATGLKEIIEILLEGEVIKESVIKTGGKPKRIFVWITPGSPTLPRSTQYHRG